MLAKTNDQTNRTKGKTVFIYGYGPARNPFFKEAQTVEANSEGCLLILSAPVSLGQRVLLMNGAGQNPIEAEIRTARSLDAQRFEVEVSFPVARPDSCQPLHSNSREK